MVICAPCAYVLSRFKFIGNSAIQSGFVAAMGVPVVIVFLPTFFLYIFLSEKIIDGVTAGGVKG